MEISGCSPFALDMPTRPAKAIAAATPTNHGNDLLAQRRTLPLLASARTFRSSLADSLFLGAKLIGNHQLTLFSIFSPTLAQDEVNWPHVMMVFSSVPLVS